MQKAIVMAQICLYVAVLTPYLSDRILGLRGLEIGAWDAPIPWLEARIWMQTGQFRVVQGLEGSIPRRLWLGSSPRWPRGLLCAQRELQADQPLCTPLPKGSQKGRTDTMSPVLISVNPRETSRRRGAYQAKKHQDSLAMSDASVPVRLPIKARRWVAPHVYRASTAMS